MKSFVTFNDDGTVAQAGTGKYPPPDSYPFTPPLQSSALATMMLVPRPASPAAVWDAGAQTLTVPPVPEGTRVEIHDMAGGELMTTLTADADDWSETITITDSGSYSAEVHVPMPFLPALTSFSIE